MPAALPVDPYVPRIVDGLRQHRAAVVVASPGAGKTTRIPPALIGTGPVILLQPRRVAARSIARRIAEEQGWTLGREVGWHVRFDRQFSRDTRLLVATEGILTARLQQDPLLSDFQTIVLDEFHERSIHADMGVALAKQAWRAREDLRILIMSATLDAERAAGYFEGCPVFDVPGALHPVDLAYRPAVPISEAVREVMSLTSGQVLCFLPGAGEVRRAAMEIRTARPPAIDVVELHGSLPPGEQDDAIAPTARRRVIVATNIAETSLTVPGVTAVIDTGHHKVARYDPERGVDSLELERISNDSAEQRAGRAGRIGPGVVRRLWHAADRLRPHREPDISRIDLAGPLLEVLAWGGDPLTFDWFERPSDEALASGIELLRLLGAADGWKLTPLGREMSRLPLHPRLARIMIEARGAQEAAIACALLSDRQALPAHPATTACDLLVDQNARDLPPAVLRGARELQRISGGGRDHCSERDLRRALLTGYPDRVARRRTTGDARVLLFSGHGAMVGPESGVRSGDYLLALDVHAGRRGEQSEARIRLASIVDRDWLTPTRTELVHEMDDASGVVRAYEREIYGAIVLRERPAAVDAAVVAQQLAAAFLRRPLTAADEQLVARLRFAGIDPDLEELAVRAASGQRRLADVHLQNGLDWATTQRLDHLAPASFKAPSGRTHSLEYRADGTVALSIKLQELFGLAETPRVGSRHEPLLILLLAPNGRPVQTTRDLRSFWATTYPEVRKELRGRYPKHPWPEDPWNAAPTARTTRAQRQP